MARKKGKFSKLWTDPIRDALYKTCSAANRDTEKYISPRIPAGELRAALRIRGIDWRRGPIPKEIESKLFFDGYKVSKAGKPRSDEIARQYIVNTLVKRGKIQVSEQGVHRYWELRLEENWLRETRAIARTGI